MAFSFNAVNIANGLNGIAANIAYGASAINTIGGALGNISNIFGFNSSNNISSNNISSNSSFSGSTNYLTNYINNYTKNPAVKYIYRKLFSDLSPDISGYTLLFMVPPNLSGFSKVLGNNNYDQFGSTFTGELAKIIPLLATNYTPPTIQINSSVLSGSSGSQHFPSELNISDNMSVTYIDTVNLDVYSYHVTWLDYIYQVHEGTLNPSDEMISNRTIDYMASFYFVKWQPDAETIQYIGKAVGCFPKELPSTELIGNRLSNDLTNITFNYAVSNYYETTKNQQNNWLFSELQNIIMSQYK